VGFLTNGELWRFYDATKFSSQKVYYEFNLKAVLELEDETAAIEAFRYFYFIFRRDYFLKRENESSDSERIKRFDEAVKSKTEDDLRSVIYGDAGNDALFETIGDSIYKSLLAHGVDCDHSEIDEIYRASLYLLFRLLFIAYVCERFKKDISDHPAKESFNLDRILAECNKSVDKANSYRGWNALKMLFEAIDRGNDDIDIPLFNGGLFDVGKAKILLRAKLFNDDVLGTIIESLLYIHSDGNIVKRDFAAISIEHLGTIYEGLLGYRFEANKVDGYSVEWAEDKKGHGYRGFFGEYDFAKLENKKGVKIILKKPRAAGSLLFNTLSIERKTTASYYTPTALVNFLVKDAIDKAYARNERIDEIKILDNACGSGHFLLAAIDYLTSVALERIDENPALKEQMELDKSRIIGECKRYKVAAVVDDLDVLRRILLKKCVFGVDLNPFAVELTKLALWLKSFIFGTPLSFIEHHIQCGDALLGLSIKEAADIISDGAVLFGQEASVLSLETKRLLTSLRNKSDATGEEVKESKRLYKEQIAPNIKKLNLALNIALETKSYAKNQKGRIAIVLGFMNDLNCFKDLTDEQIDKVSDRVTILAFSPFHYESVFADATAFDCIISNPP
jgi:hypothetical protein